MGTYRDVVLSRQHPLSETLAQLSREQVFRREVLRGLSREDTGDFVEFAARLRPPQGLVESIYLQKEGNSFFMGEVIRLLAERGVLREVDIGEYPRRCECHHCRCSLQLDSWPWSILSCRAPRGRGLNRRLLR